MESKKKVTRARKRTSKSNDCQGAKRIKSGKHQHGQNAARNKPQPPKYNLRPCKLVHKGDMRADKPLSPQFIEGIEFQHLIMLCLSRDKYCKIWEILIFSMRGFF
ncbi:hypothetical protein Tsubulata_016785 [Turnera subulata]|uniref:Uncharacterized protein n=1 Tax=Turnera subulata TaxID=218843 RepID=A0A9Q0FAM8_9ROSI|nr:hypothetical protein Tsubulata_016785 [Turnera subulata]